MCALNAQLGSLSRFPFHFPGKGSVVPWGRVMLSKQPLPLRLRNGVQQCHYELPRQTKRRWANGRHLASGPLSGSSYPSPRCGAWDSSLGTGPYQVAFLSVHLRECLQPGSTPHARPLEPELGTTMWDRQCCFSHERFPSRCVVSPGWGGGSWGKTGLRSPVPHMPHPGSTENKNE